MVVSIKEEILMGNTSYEVKQVGGFFVISDDEVFLSGLRKGALSGEFKKRVAIMHGLLTKESSTVRFNSKEHKEKVSFKFSEEDATATLVEDENYIYVFRNPIRNHRDGYIKIGEYYWYPNDITVINKRTDEHERFKSLTDRVFDNVMDDDEPRFNYYVGDLGNILQIKLNVSGIKFIFSKGTPRSSSDPYLRRVIVITDNGKQRSHTTGIHILVAVAYGDQFFIQRYQINKQDFETHHRDADTTNNRFDNVILMPKDLHRALHNGSYQAVNQLKEQYGSELPDEDVERTYELIKELEYRRGFVPAFEGGNY